MSTYREAHERQWQWTHRTVRRINGAAGYGKFESELVTTPLLWDVSLNGGPDEECGESESTGWHGLLRGDLTQGIEAAELAKLTDDERAFLRDASGAILTQVSTGFVFCEYFGPEDSARMERAWAACTEEAAGEEEAE